jgi:hypothetical protein
MVKNGVEKSKPMHFIQMQVYMHGTNINRALYLAVCKDDDRIYTERVKYDKKVAEDAIIRGKRIAMSDRMPEPCSADPSWYQCKFCPAHSFCHKAEPTKRVNCRTCAHSTAMPDSTFRCERHDADAIPEDFQHEGCVDHILHPDMVPWVMEGSENGHSVKWKIGDKWIVNGEGGYKSSEIIANPEVMDDPVVLSVKALFPDAEVVG